MFLVNKYLVTNSIENNDIIYSIKHEVSELKDKNQNNIRSIDQIIKTKKISIFQDQKNNQNT